MITIKYCYCRSVNYKTITYDELKKIMSSKVCLIIDVRSKQEFFEGHISTAVNIPLYDLNRTIDKYAINPRTMIIVYCSSGIRSVKAQEILKAKGYNNVYVLVQ